MEKGRGCVREAGWFRSAPGGGVVLAGGREGAVLFGFRQQFTGLMLTDAQRDGEEGSRSYGRSEAVCYMLKRHEEI